MATLLIKIPTQALEEEDIEAPVLEMNLPLEQHLQELCNATMRAMG
jgi:hypothetical protein